MIRLIIILLSFSLTSVAHADNLVSITQIGDDLTVNISQEGNNNTITKNIWTVPADWEGDDNTFDLRQKNTTNNNQSNYMGFHIDGDNNTVKVGQGYADQGSLETAHVQEWNTDNWEGGGNTAMIDIHGDNNILNIGQRNGGGAYSAFIKQNSTTTQNYSMTGTCTNPSGCSISVTQQ